MNPNRSNGLRMIALLLLAPAVALPQPPSSLPAFDTETIDLRAGSAVEDAKLLASDGAEEDYFGWSVAVSGSTVVVGADRTDDNGSSSGSAYVFEEPVGGWSGTLNESAELLASDGAVFDHFGRSIAISGSTVVVGATGDGAGSVYVFEEPAGGWSGTLNESAKLMPSDGAFTDYFGSSVAISGSTVVVGAYSSDNNGSSSGSAYVFEEPMGGWSGILNESAKLLASGRAEGDRFGSSVAVSVSGKTVVVGADEHAHQGDRPGSAYVFEEPARGWSGTLNENAELLASDGAADDRFGRSVAVSGSAVVVGAYGHDDNGPWSGSAYVFEEPAGGWSGTLNESVELLPSDAMAEDAFGISVAFSGSTVVVGARGDDHDANLSGSAYVFKEPAGGWPETLHQNVKLRSSDPLGLGGFGTSVAISGSIVAAGAPRYEEYAGSAYVIEVLPELSIAGDIPAAALETVDVDVELGTPGYPISATAFSIDYDETCLDFDDTDADPADGIPDAVAVHTPGDFTVTVSHDLGDTDGEIDVSIADVTPPLATLGDGALITVTFTATCSPALGTTVTAPAAFSSDPAAIFFDDLAQETPGTTADGWVTIYPGPRGDCDGNGSVTPADVTADGLEIFDGDGSRWVDVVGGAFPGSPVGCDADADTTVDAGDVSCTSLLILGSGSCGDPVPPPASGPQLVFDGTLPLSPGVPVVVPLDFASDGYGVTAIALSFDIDLTQLAFDPTDGDGDGVPDSVTFPAGAPALTLVSFDADDEDGELDLLLADLSNQPFADGTLLEIELLPAVGGLAAHRLRFSRDPPASFGDAEGREVPGTAVVAGVEIFSDGFESGDLSAW